MKPEQNQQPQARGDVEIGDEIYVHHKGQSCCGRVVCHGKHGLMLDIDGAQHKTKWDKVLGHKKRQPMKYKVIEHGEDGMLVEDGQGKRRFVKVPPEARETHELAKALTATDYPDKSMTYIHQNREVVLFFKALPQAEEKPLPLYVHRQVKNAQAVLDWARKQGFKTTVPADDLHVTQVYSKKPMVWDAVKKSVSGVTVAGGKRSVGPLGDQGAIVLHIESAELSKRWKEFSDAGASWDYEGYQPHVTITYDGKDVDLSKVKPFDGVIEFGPEVFEPLNEDWKSGVKETPLKKALPAESGKKPAPDAKPEKPEADDQQPGWNERQQGAGAPQDGQHVAFRNGEHRGHGKVTAAGEHGVTVADAAGGEHRVRHDQVTHDWAGDGDPDQEPPPDTTSDDEVLGGYDGKVTLPGEVVAKLLKEAPQELRAEVANFLREKSAGEEVERGALDAAKPKEEKPDERQEKLDKKDQPE